MTRLKCKSWEGETLSTTFSIVIRTDASSSLLYFLNVSRIEGVCAKKTHKYYDIVGKVLQRSTQ